MEVNSDHCQTGRAGRLRLLRAISALARSGARFKIGITGDPDSRVLRPDYRYSSYDEMLVLYKTSSESVVRGLEDYLVASYGDRCDNSIGGGGGRLEDPPYYLYIVR